MEFFISANSFASGVLDNDVWVTLKEHKDQM